MSEISHPKGVSEWESDTESEWTYPTRAEAIEEESEQTKEIRKLKAELQGSLEKNEQLENDKKQLEEENKQLKERLPKKHNPQHSPRQMPDLAEVQRADAVLFGEQLKLYAQQRHEFESGLHKEGVLRLLEHLDVDQLREILRLHFRVIEESSELRPLVSALWLSAL